MFLLAPLVLAGPLLLLASALVALTARGPLGWLAAGALLAALGVLGREVVRRTRAWWRSTKVPEQTAPRPRRRHLPL